MIEKFNEWIETQDPDKNNFRLFFKESYGSHDWQEIMAELAYEIFQLHVCVDGLIQDMDGEQSNGEQPK